MVAGIYQLCWPCCPCTSLPCANPAVHTRPSPRRDCRDKHKLYCKPFTCLLEVAVKTIQSKKNILHMFLSGANFRKLETGAKCLQEHQLVPGARKHRNKQVSKSRKAYNCRAQQEPELTTETVIFWQQRNSKSMLRPDLVAGWHLQHPATDAFHFCSLYNSSAQ